MGNGAYEMCVDSGHGGPLTPRTAVSGGTADHNLVPIDILSDDLDSISRYCNQINESRH